VERQFKRIAIVNRGEPAMRLIHAVRELNREQGLGLETVALYTDVDQGAMFVREADDAVAIGPATYIDDLGHPNTGYLDYRRLERALVGTRAEAAWVGWGFVAEHPEFAELCRRLGVIFIGPDPEVLRLLGDRIGARRLAEAAGVPVAPWSGGPVETIEEARLHAERIGYPLMVKATAGGGGRGIRRVHAAAELDRAFAGARDEARRTFGDPTVFMERLAEAARHIEVQVIADHHGTAWAAGVRDCSVQRRYQKVVEESASTALTAEQDRELREAAVRLCLAAGYHNAGAVEFLYDLERRAFFFMQVNARLQAEHPVTEVTTGLDLVKLQLHVARGGRLGEEPPAPVGHAVEVRLKAEDPDNDFAPAPGTLDLFRIATGPGLRTETGFVEGDLVPAEFDSMIAKLVAWGHDRNEALARLSRALAESAVVIRGGTGNKAFLLELLQHPDLRAGMVDTGWLDRLTAGERRPSDLHADVALLQAAVEAYDAELAAERARFFAGATRGRPEVRQGVGVTMDLRHRGHHYRLTVCRVGPHVYRVEVDRHRVDVEVERPGPFDRRVWYGGRRWRVLTVRSGLDQLVEVEGVPHSISGDGGGVVRAPAPAVVVSVAVRPGDELAPGDKLAVLEAMKTETTMTAPFGGRVARVLVSSNMQVDAGAPLVQIEAADGLVSGGGERIRFGAPAPPGPRRADPVARVRQALEGIHHQTLGFDVGVADATRLVDDYVAAAKELDAADPVLLAAEDEVLATFADVCTLFRPVPEHTDVEGEQVHSAGRTSTPTCGSPTRRPSGCRPPSWTTCAARCGTTGSARSTAGRSSTRACCGSTRPTGGPTSRSRRSPPSWSGGSSTRTCWRPPPTLGCWCCWTGWWPPPGAATRPPATWPRRSATGSSTSRSWSRPVTGSTSRRSPSSPSWTPTPAAPAASGASPPSSPARSR
jgi:acetyl/propionyl-CoA carboxylase alpha subunit